jgi:hypothetical protein
VAEPVFFIEKVVFGELAGAQLAQKHLLHILRKRRALLPWLD